MERVSASRKIQMSHEVEWSHIAVLGNIKHLLHHGLPDISGMGMIDRRIQSETGDGDGFPDPQSVKFDPDIFPRIFLIRGIQVNLPGQIRNAWFAPRLYSWISPLVE